MEEKKEQAKLLISELLDNTKSYDGIRDIINSVFDVDIDADNYFWHELEDVIVDKIVEHIEENQD